MFNICFEVERWKYNEQYGVWVSTKGHLKDKNKRLVAPRMTPGGYLYYKKKAVHRLVMETWRPLDDYNRMTVDHLNQNKRDNSLENLEWVLTEENQRRAAENMVPYDELKTYEGYEVFAQQLEAAKKQIEVKSQMCEKLSSLYSEKCGQFSSLKQQFSELEQRTRSNKASVGHVLKLEKENAELRLKITSLQMLLTGIQENDAVAADMA